MMDYQCGQCKHYLIQSEFAGICTNPGCSFFCTHVGITSTCSKWEAENTVHEHSPPTKAESLCSRCFHRNVCPSILKERLLIKELVYGRNPICRDFVESIYCENCKHSKRDGSGTIYCKKWDTWEIPEKGFCFLGERNQNG